MATSAWARRSSNDPPAVRPYLSDRYWCQRDGWRGSPPTIHKLDSPARSACSCSHATCRSRASRAVPTIPDTPHAASTASATVIPLDRPSRARTQASPGTSLISTTDRVGSAHRLSVVTASYPSTSAARATAPVVRVPRVLEGGLSSTARRVPPGRGVGVPMPTLIPLHRSRPARRRGPSRPGRPQRAGGARGVDTTPRAASPSW
ncbi:hypothetical protein SAMN04488561_1903 [Jiangella alba]|uniref:Uncharacterized protein n=1 Tax=Jiangella alba TaxID=561176 RepID=A0A1H5K5E9_9ACTN|nr:hypothetical protein SAMN04488561_1903 [Jiangella alba]